MKHTRLKTVRIIRDSTNATWLILIVPLLLLGGVAFDLWRSTTSIPPSLALIPESQSSFVGIDRLDRFIQRGRDHQPILRQVLAKLTDVDWVNVIDDGCTTVPQADQLTDFGIDGSGPAAFFAIDGRLAIALPVADQAKFRGALTGGLWEKDDDLCSERVTDISTESGETGQLQRLALVDGLQLCYGEASPAVAVVLLGVKDGTVDSCSRPLVSTLPAAVVDSSNRSRFADDDGFLSILAELNQIEVGTGDAGVWAMLPGAQMFPAESVLARVALRLDEIDASAFMSLDTRDGTMLDGLARKTPLTVPLQSSAGQFLLAALRDPQAFDYVDRANRKAKEAQLRNNSQPLTYWPALRDVPVADDLNYVVTAIDQALQPSTSQLQVAAVPDADGVPGFVLQFDFGSPEAARAFLDNLALRLRVVSEAEALGCSATGVDIAKFLGGDIGHDDAKEALVIPCNTQIAVDPQISDHFDDYIAGGMKGCLSAQEVLSSMPHALWQEYSDSGAVLKTTCRPDISRFELDTSLLTGRPANYGAVPGHESAGLIYISPLKSELAKNTMRNRLDKQFDENGLNNSFYRWVGGVTGNKVIIASRTNVFDAYQSAAKTEIEDPAKFSATVAMNTLEQQLAAYPPEVKEAMTSDTFSPDSLRGYQTLAVDIDPAEAHHGLDLNLRLTRQ